MSQLNKIRYKSDKVGPKVLVLGAIHGNEPAGTRASSKAMEFLKDVELKKGLITFVPICNPAAQVHNVRFIAENLNRIMQRHFNPDTLERDYANQICNLIEEHDYILDLHSTHVAGDLPTVFNDFVTEDTTAWANKLGIQTIITSWRDMLNNCNAPSDFSDTVYHAHNHGKKALLVECGYHEDASAENNAYRAIIKTMEHLEMIDSSRDDDITQRIAHMYKVVFKGLDNGTFIKEWKHLDKVKKGDTIAKLNSGKHLTADFDGYIVIPFPDAKINEEWFYLARKDDPLSNL